MKGTYFLLVFQAYLMLSLLTGALGNKPPPKAPKDTASPPPQASGASGRVSNSSDLSILNEFTVLTTLQQFTYQLNSQAVTWETAYRACTSLGEALRTQDRESGRNSSKSHNYHIVDLLTADNAERDTVTNRLREKQDVDCIWVNTQTRTVDGQQILISESNKGKKIQYYDPNLFSSSKNRTVKKREVQAGGTNKIIALTVTETLFPWIKELRNSTDGQCIPGCEPRVCNIVLDNKCTVAPSVCSQVQPPRCVVIEPENQTRQCSGGCEDCQIESLTCYVRTQTCIVNRQRVCNITNPACEVTNSSCEVTRQNCITYRKPCTLTEGPKKECAGESVCLNRTRETFCTLVPDPRCRTLNISNNDCPTYFNCTLDPVCIKPILCRPAAVRCPPAETFCPPPIVRCLAPRVTCGKPVLTCSPPTILCPTPEVVCSRPRVRCGAPVIKCSQVLATCTDPEINCRKGQVACPPPRVSCDEPPPCTVENTDEPPPCDPPKCDSSTGGCRCTRMAKLLNYGFEHCECTQKCHALCKY